MPLTVNGMEELQKQMTMLLEEVDSGRTIDAALMAGAQPIYQTMQANAPDHAYRKTGKIVTNFGTLKRSLKIRKPRTMQGERTVTIGVHYKDSPTDSNTGAYYANPVEAGHGGPYPAPAHAFIAPAYDTRVEEAFQNIVTSLSNNLGKK